MYSIPPPSAALYESSGTLPLPMVEGKIPAGFPSPADDFLHKRQDLNELLITHPLATFFWKVAGWSLINIGIYDGDILVVNRALTPMHGDVVVAQVDGGFTVKILHKHDGCIKLMAANPEFTEITFREGQELVIIGVVTVSIKQFTRNRNAPAQQQTRERERSQT